VRQVTYVSYYIHPTMGASHGKSKQEQKEEARLWAETKDIELATLYGEHTKLLNEMRLLQLDFQAMKRTMEQEVAQCQAQQLRAVEELNQQKAETEAVKQALETFKQNMFDDAGGYEGTTFTSPHSIFAWRVAKRFMPKQ